MSISLPVFLLVCGTAVRLDIRMFQQLPPINVFKGLLDFDGNHGIQAAFKYDCVGNRSLGNIGHLNLLQLDYLLLGY